MHRIKTLGGLIVLPGFQKETFMAKRIEFKTLGADMIEVRPTDTKNKGKATLLLYQTARCPMEILDESCPGAWASDYKEVAGNVYCGIGIKIDDEWVWRWNAGTEGNIGEGKSTASDAFKRAATMWGIGRELYNTPRVKIDCPDSYYYNDKMTMTFSVKEIEWDENRRCKRLVIVDRFGKEVYNYGGDGQVENETRIQMTKHNKPNSEILRSFCSEKKREEGVDQDDLLRFYNWYYDRVDAYSNTLKPEIIWNSWCSHRKTA